MRKGKGLRNVLLLATLVQGLFLLFYHSTRPDAGNAGAGAHVGRADANVWQADAGQQTMVPPTLLPHTPNAVEERGPHAAASSGGGVSSSPFQSEDGEESPRAHRPGLCAGSQLGWIPPKPARRSARRLLQGGSNSVVDRRRQRAAQKARLAALEDERTSVSWRTTWCDEEKAFYRNPGRKLANLDPAERALHLCLRGTKNCAAQVRLAQDKAKSLPSVNRLAARERLPCLFSNRIACPINTTVRNRETGYAYEQVPFDLPLPERDLGERFSTCAVVGNGASVLSAEHGDAIDSHEAVFRFNDLMRYSCLDPSDSHFSICGAGNNGTLAPPPPPPPPPAARARAKISKPKPPAPAPHLPLSVLQDDDVRYEPFTGKRTRFRLFNRKHALKLETLGRSSRVQYRPADEGESFVFWHHGSVEQGAKVANEFPEHRMYFLSTDTINWQVGLYSAVRKDLYALGLGPFQCYSALSSGVHGVLMALQVCDSVDLYGFSLTAQDMEGHVHFRPIRESPSQAHSWQFDYVFLRALQLAGLIGIC